MFSSWFSQFFHREANAGHSTANRNLQRRISSLYDTNKAEKKEESPILKELQSQSKVKRISRAYEENIASFNDSMNCSLVKPLNKTPLAAKFVRVKAPEVMEEPQRRETTPEVLPTPVKLKEKTPEIKQEPECRENLEKTLEALPDPEKTPTALPEPVKPKEETPEAIQEPMRSEKTPEASPAPVKLKEETPEAKSVYVREVMPEVNAKTPVAKPIAKPEHKIPPWRCSLDQLIELDAKYIRHMSRLITNYVRPFIKRFSTQYNMGSMADRIFGPLEPIYNFHWQRFHPTLEHARHDIIWFAAELSKKCRDGYFNRYIIFAMNHKVSATSLVLGLHFLTLNGSFRNAHTDVRITTEVSSMKSPN